MDETPASGRPDPEAPVDSEVRRRGAEYRSVVDVPFDGQLDLLGLPVRMSDLLS